MIYKTINWVVLIWSIIRLLIPDSREENNTYYFLFYCALFILSFDRLVDIYFKDSKNEQNS